MRETKAGSKQSNSIVAACLWRKRLEKISERGGKKLGRLH
jgi:hypothetical protein